MAEDAYNKKIGDLQKHIPFLENMIAQLKDPKGKPREAQLSKLEAVHNMITDRNKKWKFETLLKCEEVITKLQTKVKANRLSVFPEVKELFRTDRTTAVSQTVSEIMNALKFSNARAKLNSEIATPKSPSPVREPAVKLPPKIIPTENTKTTFKIDPDDFNIRSWKKASSAIVTEERYVNERPDIYNSAAKSLISPPAAKPKSIFDRLGPVVAADANKPLLSDADLESLRAGDDFEVVVAAAAAGPDETTRKDNEKPPSDLKPPSKSTPRIVPVPSSKPKSPKLECPKQDEKRPSKTKAPPPKVEKLKDCDMFGNLLTSIDSKILEGSKKKEGGKKKEHDKKSAKRHEKVKTEPPVVKAKEEKIEVKVEVPGDKPVRLADKYNPKPKKHVDADLEKTVGDSIQKRMENDPRISLKIDIFTNSGSGNGKDRNFESRDPRRRLSLLQESPPPQQQQTHYAPPQPPQRLDLPIIRDPRRPQSRFSPPPIQISPFAQAQTFQNFAPPPHQARNVFNNHGVAPYQQQAYFNQNYAAPSLRYDPNPPSVRFEPPPLSQASSFGTAPKKSFNPFEPLDSSGREEKESEFFNQPLQSPPLESQNFQRGMYGPASRGGGGGGGAKFGRGGAGYYNQYSNRARFDRNSEFRRPANKSSEASWDRAKKDEVHPKYPKDVSRTKYDEIYSKLEKDKETFTSPLESLYSDPKSSIKATIQSFKIPKKYKTEEAEAPPHVEKHKESKPPPPAAKVKEEPKAKRHGEESGGCAADVLLTKKKKKKKKIKRAPSPPSSPEPAPADEDSSDSDVPLKVARRKPTRAKLRRKPLKDSDDDSDDDVGRKTRRAKIVAKKRLIEDSDETDSDETKRVPSPKPKDDDDAVSRNIEVKDLKIVVEKNIELSKKIEEIKAEGGPSKQEEEHSEEASGGVKGEERKAKSDVELAKELLMETNAGLQNVNDKQLIEFVLQNFKKIHQLFNRDSGSGSDAEDGAEAKKKGKRKEPEVVKQEGEQQQEEQENPPPEPQKEAEEETPKVKPAIRRKPGPKPRGRFKRGGAVKKENNVGRMTRTRSATLLAAPRRARRSELDKLHEDIKEMLMGGEVLTGSTKRACTIQKDEQEDAPEKTTSDDELNKVMDPSKDDPTKLKAKGAKLRVLIEKTDLAKLLIKDETRKKEEEDVDVDVEEETLEEKGEGGDDVFEPQIDKAGPRQLRIFKKKKRRFNWASGVIKKKKKGAFQKAPPTNENKNAPSDDDAAADPFGGSFPELGELVYVEPDKEYYPKDGKSDCKLCSFQGKFIVQHYKGVHPEHEVLIARMNPAYAERAVRESASNDYGSVDAFDMLNAQRTKKLRFNYQCPFCHIKFFNENAEVFYDHLSGHTGEYRFSCPFCNFRTSTGRNLRPHIMTSHNRSSENVVRPSWPPPPNFKYVFGYLCAECHYVQLNKNAVEDHVKIYHLENQKIHKVNMSAMPCEEIDEGGDGGEVVSEMAPPSEVDRHVDETIERVVRAEQEPVAFPAVRPRKRRTKRVPGPQVKQLRVFELIDEIAPIIKDEPPDEAVVKDTPPKPKSPDLNAFMCNPDSTTVEERSVEEEENRPKKTKEIHEIVKPAARTSIVDKLQSRLYTTTPPSPPEEVQQCQDAPPISDPIGPEMPPPPPLLLIDRTKKSPIDSIVNNKNPIATEVLPPKNTAPISSIINRLQDKLVGEVNKQLPPLTHYRNLKTEEDAPELSLRIGPVQVMLNKSFVLYACFVPTCVFCTDKQNIFETHCKYTHKNFVCAFEEPNKCDVCHVKIDHEGNYVSMHDAYLHLVGTHGDFLEKLEAKRKHEEEQQHREEKEKASPPPTENVVPEFKLPHEVPNLISQGDDENTGAKYPFVITSVTSLAPPKKNNYEEVAASALSNKTPTSSGPSSAAAAAAVIRPVPLSKLRVTTADVITTPTSGATLTLSTSSKSQPLDLSAGVAPQKKPPPVFKKFVITSTTPSTTSLPLQQPVLLNHFIGNHQLTSGNVLPKIPTLTLPMLGPSPANKTATPPSSSSSSSTSPKRQIILRDIPLKLPEKLQSRKSPKALGALLSLKKNRQLFKCPEFYCIYSTDLSAELNKHMTAFHNFADQALLSCLYCDYKVSRETYAIHVEVKHGHCSYGCEYCLYRTTSAYFIGIHQELQHPQLPSKIISIPLFPSSVKAISSDATVSIRKIVLPYVCGNWGCSFKTLFTYDFFVHLEGHAKTLRCGSCTRQFATPSAMVNHWTNHKVYPFHCRYCLYGNKATHGIGRHQACCHQSFDYSVLCRIFVSDSTERQPADYNCDEDEVYQRLLKWPEDSNTPEGKTYKDLAGTNQDKEDENNGKGEVIQLTMDHILAKRELVIQLPMDHVLVKQDEVVGPPTEEKLCLDEPAIFTNESADSDDVDPLSLDTETLQKEIEEKNEENRENDDDDDAAASSSEPLDEESFGPDEPCGRNLYKCKCDADFLSSVELRTHIMQCQKEKPFHCAHCARPFKTITGLMHHYRDHGPARFKCSLCQFKRRHQFAVRTHMKVVHNVGNVMLLPVVAKKVDMDNDDFVLRPRQCGRKSTDSSTVLPTKASVEEAPTAEAKYVFGPNEIDLLPRPPIYQFDVKCATCSYATKVKSNMVRHLQFHQTEQEVPVIAPVNPVPCLEKSERMFDKMVNLASSSHVGGRMGGVKNEKPDKAKAEEVAVNIPAFVPTGKRYICGAENCNYLCPEEAMLRRHLTAFHSDDGIYTCHHCKIKISEEKSLNIESVMKHLKLHDCNLYQCPHCKMINHLRHKMDRHLTEKHFDKAPTMLVIREKVKVTAADSDPSASVLEKELSKEAKPWRCGMCKYRCPSFNEIKSHAFNKHNVDAKHKCALCSYKGELKDGFAEHFEKKHPGHQPDVIVCFFKDEQAEKPKPPPTENEPEFNTTPLWQRNKQHVKHIRGILLEESNVPEKTTKKIKPSPKPATAKKDDAEDGASSPKKSSALGIVEAPGPRANQKTFKIVKRALKTKGGKVLKVSGYKFESGAPAAAKKSDEFIDVISCEDAAKQDAECVEDKTIETPSATTTTSNATKRSLKLVNIRTLLEDPSGSEMPGFVNITTNVTRETPPAGGDLETIEIIDDDSGGGGEVSSKKRKIDLTFREINKMSKSELLAGNYMGTYGPYGSPWDGKYKCPLCEKMTCRSEREFTVHLYRELQYGAYKCNVCGETDLSDEAIRKHYALKHGVINSDDIVQMGWDRQIEAWIHKVIAFQSRILKLEKKPKAEGGAAAAAAAEPEKTGAAADALETEEDGEKGRTLYCTFCDYRCKYSGDRRKHELRHWSTKPFSCGYCAYEAIYKSVMVKHMHRFHKGSEVLVRENEMDDGVVIKPIKIIKKKGGGGGSSQASEEPSWAEPQPAAAGDSSQEAALSKLSGQAQNFQCFYCDFVGTMSEQTMHREVHHSILPLKLYSYKCNYCEMVFVTLVSLNAHFFGAHPGLEQNFTSVECKTDKKFRCPTCFYTSDDYSVVKYHVRGHFKPFCCLYCDERFSYWNQIHKHHTETHPASFYEYKYILSVEKDTWTEMEAIQVRRGGSYEVITETKSTKRRKSSSKRLDPASNNNNNNNTVEEDEAEEEEEDDDDVMIIEDESSHQAKKPAPDNEIAAAGGKVMKATARKSTSVHVRPPSEGFSYYGTRPDDTDLTGIITTVEIMGASVTMYVEQLSKIFYLFPIVLVEDCGPL